MEAENQRRYNRETIYDSFLHPRAWRDDYTPFGEKRLDPLDNRDKAGLTGHIEDAATGLTYMQARYYDPNIGRFLSKDPVDFRVGGVGHFNRYAYVENNPIGNIDPNGQDAATVVKRVCTATIHTRILCAAGVAAGAVILGSAAATVSRQDAMVNGPRLRATVPPLRNESADDDETDITIPEKIEDQLGERGWTEEEIEDVVGEGQTGTSSDGSGGRGSNPASASVYGTESAHVVVNDETGEVMQVSDKTDPDWVPDSRITWNE